MFQDKVYLRQDQGDQGGLEDPILKMKGNSTFQFQTRNVGMLRVFHPPWYSLALVKQTLAPSLKVPISQIDPIITFMLRQ